MTILITSGGTIVKIDDVRHLGNCGTGYFLSQIAEECLVAGHKVIYLHAKRAKKPFERYFNFDPNKSSAPQFKDILKAQNIFRKYKRKVEYFEFTTFDDYAKKLEAILRSKKVDIAFLGAAVSDYRVDPVVGKISSEGDELCLRLNKNLKLIKKVKEWSRQPIFQVGFKLLSGVRDEELVESAYKSGLDNKSDLTIGNDLKRIRQNKREVFMVTPERGVHRLSRDEIAKRIVNFVIKRAKTHHLRSVVRTNKELSTKFAPEFQQFRALSNLLFQKKLMTPFFTGSKSSHGSLGLRVNGGFLITSRGSNKENLSDDDIVLVSGIDWKKRLIKAVSTSNAKASLNAPLFQKIFEQFPNANAIVHTHSFDKNYPTTGFAETPGTLEYATAPIKLLRRNVAVNLNNHGLIATGADLALAANLILKSKRIKGNCYKNFPELYDLLYKRYLKTIPDFIRLVKRKVSSGSHILDLAAGTGEVTLPMLSARYFVTALDLNGGMLENLRDKVPESLQTRLATVVKNFNSLDYTDQFDAITLRQAINYYIGSKELSKGLVGIYNSLKMGGKFIFNAPNFSITRKEYKSINVTYKSEDLTALVLEKNILNERLLTHAQNSLVWGKDLSTKLYMDSNSFYMYTKNEFEDSLRNAGFKKIAFYSSGLKKYSENDKSLYCVAEK